MKVYCRCVRVPDEGFIGDVLGYQMKVLLGDVLGYQMKVYWRRVRVPAPINLHQVP